MKGNEKVYRFILSVYYLRARIKKLRLKIHNFDESSPTAPELKT